jgi:membrane protein
MRIIDEIGTAYDGAVAAARKRSHVFDHLWRAKDRFNEVLAGRLAAAISYYGFFAAFSLAVVAYSVLGRVLGTSTNGVVGTVNRYVTDAVPLVTQTARQVGSGEVTAVGLVTLVLTGVGWVESLRSSQRAVWMLDQHPGHWLVRRVIDLGMLVGLGILLLLSLVMTTTVDWLLGRLAGNHPTGAAGTALHMSGPVLELVVNLVLAAAVLAAVPRLRLSMRRLVPAATLVAVGIELLNDAGRWYITRTESRPAYQLVAGAVGLLVYLYLVNQLILFGAALAATAPRGLAQDLAGGGAHTAPANAGIAGTGAGDNVGEPHAQRHPKPR